MKLAVVDVGNTSTAVGLWSDGRVTCVSHCDEGFADASAAVGKIASRKGVSALAYVSVVPKADRSWRAFAKKLGLEFRQVSHLCFLSAGQKQPIAIDYPSPETIGADRLADAAGAVSRYGAPLIVMDFGTALTAAVVTRDCVWRGGVIAPGFPLMRDYLFERTAKLPRMKIGTSYDGDPVALTQIAAVTQLVMCPKCPNAPERRKLWTAALRRAKAASDDGYVKTFCNQQLRLCE